MFCNIDKLLKDLFVLYAYRVEYCILWWVNPILSESDNPCVILGQLIVFIENRVDSLFWVRFVFSLGFVCWVTGTDEPDFFKKIPDFFLPIKNIFEYEWEYRYLLFNIKDNIYTGGKIANHFFIMVSQKYYFFPLGVHISFVFKYVVFRSVFGSIKYFLPGFGFTSNRISISSEYTTLRAGF